jgi:hypothetical protein
MNIFQKIKAALTVKSTVENEIKEARIMDTVTSKPGWKTSTFWVKIFTVDVPILYMAIKGFLPPETAVKMEAVGLGVYAVYRTVSETVTKVQNVKLANGPVAAGVVGAETATATATVKAG